MAIYSTNVSYLRTIPKQLVNLLVYTLCFFPSLSYSQWSAEVAFTTNYLWRGMTQTDDKPGISASLDYETETGFYAGAWVSNVEFDSANYELDLFAGFYSEWENVSWDISYVHYFFPDSLSEDELELGEILIVANVGNFTLGSAVLGTSDARESGDFGDSLYVYGEYQVDWSEDASTVFHLGEYSGDYVSDEPILVYEVRLNWNQFTLTAAMAESDEREVDEKNIALTYSVPISL